MSSDFFLLPRSERAALNLAAREAEVDHGLPSPTQHHGNQH
ncbi:MAG TPA: hypothetical protein VF680_11470 [Allosphingosinicella sp.]|jgi:hypothetical protein